MAIISIVRRITNRIGSAVTEGSAFLAETENLVGAMSVKPNAARKNLIDDLIRGLKTDGIWGRLDAFWVLAAHDSQAGRLNWKTPGTFTLTESGTGTWTTDRGWAGNGTDGVLSSGLAPSACTLLTQNDGSAFAWSRSSAQSSAAFFGTTTGAGLLIQPRNASDLYGYRVNQSTSTTTANADGTGLYAATRTGANATQGYKNGAAIGSAGAVASATRSAVVLGFGRVNNLYTTVQAAAGGIGASLDSTQQGNLYTRLNTFMTAIGAA